MSINADCAKVMKTLASCQNEKHLAIARRMSGNFDKMYKDKSTDYSRCAGEIFVQDSGFVYWFGLPIQQTATYPVNSFMKSVHAAEYAIRRTNKSQKLGVE